MVNDLRSDLTVGSATFTGDVAARLRLENVHDADPGRYPHIDLDDLAAREPALVVLPDEPYPFHAGDEPEMFPRQRVAGRGPQPDLVRPFRRHRALGALVPAGRGPVRAALKRMAPSSILPCRRVSTSLR